MNDFLPRSIEMNLLNSASRRVTVLLRIFRQEPYITCKTTSTNSQYHGESLVKIGDISKVVKPAKNLLFVPSNYVTGELSQDTLRHLRWMLQKDLLGQDMFLIGRPGPLRRRLAMQFSELTNRELEFVSLSRDTTEADLKQRREIKNGTAIYYDQSAVRAAVAGRILVLEGIEKAERNVLPVLNNLLENREMHLEDGRFLIPAKRYDNLLKNHSKEELGKWKLVRVSEDFRVIALGIPVPRYVGNPLDPPLRSRFQARDIGGVNYKEQLEHLRQLVPSADPARLAQLLSCSQALLTSESSGLRLPDFPIDNLPIAAQILESFPGLTIYDVFYRLYPYRSFLNPEGQDAVESALSTFQILMDKSHHNPLSVGNINLQEGIADIEIASVQHRTNLQLPCGLESGKMLSNNYIATPYQEELLANLMLAHQYKDICLIGPRGCGKSSTVLQLAKLLNYVVEPIVLYQDMTSRDLLQQRTTLANGDTVWRNSPLVTAALEGKLAILDGIHRVHPSTLAVVHRLVHDREVTLYDGTRLLQHDRYDSCKEKQNMTDEEMKSSGVLRIHPSFRIIGLAEPPEQGNNLTQWLSPEMLSLFLYHEMRPLKSEEEIELIQNMYGKPDATLKKVIDVAHRMRDSQDPTVRTISASLSTRQLLRISRRMKLYPDSPANAIQRACLARFLPTLSQQTLNRFLSDHDLDIALQQEEFADAVCKIEGDHLIIGSTKVPRYKTDTTTKIPDILFYDVPQHVAVLEKLLQDFCLGEHLLLIGNQGVGKNKLADRLLQLLNRPREYIQLHRDTTVQTLTLQPTVRDGVVIYEDSPLVRAVKSGHVLIVDEADKAPTHVTCILKTLVESGEMILSDGRRIVPSNYPRLADGSKDLVPIHQDFRIIVLANRPGFPFLGNDFFGALGDLFSCHAVDNPSAESEHALLKQYGPDVPDKVIMRLVKAFAELRNMADQGLLQYPYSTREVVNIVKHLQEFPNENLVNIVGNVFDFDMYSQEAKDTLIDILNKHGIPIKTDANNVFLGKEFSLPSLQLAGEWKTCPNPIGAIAVEERFLKSTPSSFLRSNKHILDVTEARGSLFTEMQSYWMLPIGETGIIGNIAVCKNIDNNPLQDWIHVLCLNPPTLFSMQPSGKDIFELSLDSLLRPVQGRKPLYKLWPGKSGSNSVVIHEEITNGLYLVDPIAGSALTISMSSPLDQVSRTFAETLNLGSKRKSWSLVPDLLEESNLVILYESGSNCIDAVNLDTMVAYSLPMPFELKHVYAPSFDRWLVEDTESRKYLLTKSKASDLIPFTLKSIEESRSNSLLENLVSQGSSQLPSPLLSEALNQKIGSPNRLFASRRSNAVIGVGFPELEYSNYQFYAWPRMQISITEESLGKTVIIPECGLVVRPTTYNDLPEEMKAEEKASDMKFLEVTDTARHKLRFIPIPESRDISALRAWVYSRNEIPIVIAPTSNNGLAMVDASGCVRLWEVEVENIAKSLYDWKQMIGERENIQLTIEKPSGKDVSAPKHGKVDEKGDPHVGGNTWAGGTGGRDTAGLGGKGGPYRLDAGHNVHQVSQEEKDAVPDHVKKAAHEMAKKAFKQRLKEIQMSEYDASVYESFSNSVTKQVQALRVVLSSLQAKSKERTWLRHQTAGELDDTKLIEGLTGEKSIYRRRAEKEPELGTPQTKPKRLRLVVDVSGSMYRFNGYDGRLDREMEVVVMVMEAFQGFEREIQYDIIGHSGEDHYVKFVDHKTPPADNKQRLDIVKTMYAHSQYCLSGDHTLAAIKYGINELSKEDCDEAILVALSDANLQRYGISPENLARTLTSEQNVNAYAVFIGSLGDEAVRLTKKLPAGRGFVCLDLTKLPQILQQIFSSSVVK